MSLYRKGHGLVGMHHNSALTLVFVKMCSLASSSALVFETLNSHVQT